MPDTPVTPAPAPAAPAVQAPTEQPIEDMVDDLGTEDMADEPGAAPELDQQPSVETGGPGPSTLTTMWRQGEGECLTMVRAAMG